MNAPSPLSGFKPHKLSVDDVLTLERSGAFAGLPRLELLDGTLYEMSPQTSLHVRVRNRLTFRLQSRIVELGLPCEAFSEATISIGPNHAPEPDVVISNMPDADGYYPVSSILLAVEVAVTSLQSDLTFKKSLYASAAIPEYWVVDAEAQLIHIFWSPNGTGYVNSKAIAIGASLASQTITGLSVETSGLV
jgi:Uma2 family endonuclease